MMGREGKGVRRGKGKGKGDGRKGEVGGVDTPWSDL